MSIIMRSTIERFAQILVVIWSLTALESADGGSVTWYEPLPVKTVSSAGDDPTPAEVKLFEGHPASLSWNFSLTSVTLFAVNIRFNTDSLALSGPGGSAAQVRDAYKDKFNFTWISQRLTLVIFNVTAAYDESKGKFSCELTTAEGAWIRKIQVKIVERTKIVGVTKNQDVHEHSEVTLSCNATGKPEPNITWTRVGENGTDSGALQSKDGFLLMANISRSSNGTYRCKAFNEVGEPVNQTVTVIVRFKPDNVTLERNTTENNGCTDMWVNFTCHSSEANPPVHNYVLIKNETKFIFSGKGTWIEKISRGETFVYKCQAYQQVDNVTSTNDITLKVNKPPTVEQVLNRTVKEGGNVINECNVTGPPPPTVFWKILNTNEVIYGKLLNIPNISRNQSGEYKCFANNTCGNDSSTIVIDVQYLPNITGIMNDMTVNDGDRVTLDCRADGNPRPKIRWIFNNRSYVPRSFYITGKQNEGFYRCIAENRVGRDESTRDVYLAILYYRPFNTTVRINSGNSSVIANQTFTISCDTQANPPATYEIFRDDGNKVGSNSVVTTSVTEGEGNNSVTFTCKASNAYGDGPTAKITVEVQYATKKTKEPSNCPKYVQTGREIKLECHVEGNPPPNIIWSVGGEPIDSDLSNNSYTPRTTGVFGCTCSACNGIGECVNLTFHHSADSFLAKKFLLMMVEQDLTLNADLNNDQSDEYKKKDNEVKRKVKEALSTCDKHSTSQIKLRPHGKSTKIYFHLLFVKLMGKSALLDALQKATQKDGPLANFNSITLEVSDIPAKKNCSSFYVDDQICEKVKLAWVIFFICAGTILVVVIFIFWYRLHKKRNCKDQRVGNCENEDQLALPSNHSTLSEGNPYAGENGGYANSGPLPAVKVVSEQELGAASVDSENTYAKVDKSKKKDKKKDKKAADEKPTEDQYAVVDKSKKKIKKNEPDATYAEVDMSKKSKKKPKPGEVLYADLSEFQEMQKMPEVSTSPKTLPPIKLPEAYVETQYADISQFLKGNPEDKRAEPPKESTTSTVSNIATGNKEEYSAGNAGDGAETTNETGF